MKVIKTDIIIIGAGLTGLTLAYYLKKHPVDVTVIEARKRLGGRIFTKNNPNSANIELGATWLGKQHVQLLKLLGELKLQIFKQEMGKFAIYEIYPDNKFETVPLPDSNDPSFRIKNGTEQLIEKLVSQKDKNQFFTNQVIKNIEKTEESITARSDTHIFKGSVIISTLPPLLFSKSIQVNPSLPNELIEVANKTHTWMGDSIKVGLTFDHKLWVGKNLSGTIFSNVGPINEMYDHSNFEDTLFSLKGFLSTGYADLDKNERLKLILNQLEKYYGKEVYNYLRYEEMVWKNEPFTAIEHSEFLLPHQNNGHFLYQKNYLNNSLYLAGTETSNSYGGYMEGAVNSANHIYNQLNKMNFLAPRKN